MARPQKLSKDELLDAARQVIARRGPAATTADIAAAAGIRIGSLYYRYPNRDVLFLALWVRSIKRFQQHFLAALSSSSDPKAALVAAAASIPAYCRNHPEEARALTLFRHTEVLQRLDDHVPELAECPAELTHQLRTLNDEVKEQFAAIVTTLCPDPAAIDYAYTATVEATYGCIRPYLRPTAPPIPPWLEDLVSAMTAGALSAWPPGKHTTTAQQRRRH